MEQKIINNQEKPILRLVSPIPVSVNHYVKPRAFIMGGKAQVNMYETAEAKAYKKQFVQYIIKEVKNQKWSLLPNKTQHFYIDAFFYFPRTDMDANNYWKILLDSITETQTIWLDDNVTCERVMGIWYDTKNPRIELDIYPVQYIGVFPDGEHLINFKNAYCEKCGRYARNCSILVKAIEGKVQDEIDGIRCEKFKEVK
jgi:Holliday junction resolvase RusA-like endonuclease